MRVSDGGYEACRVLHVVVCCRVGYRQQHHYAKHEFHEDVTEVRSVVRPPRQHRVRIGIRLGNRLHEGATHFPHVMSRPVMSLLV